NGERKYFNPQDCGKSSWPAPGSDDSNHPNRHKAGGDDRPATRISAELPAERLRSVFFAGPSGNAKRDITAVIRFLVFPELFRHIGISTYWHLYIAEPTGIHDTIANYRAVRLMGSDLLFICVDQRFVIQIC